MKITLYATFKLLAGQKNLEVSLPPGVTVRAAIEEIVKSYPMLRTHWLNDAGELHAHVHVFVNGNEVPTLTDGFETRLAESDELDFFPPVAGGSGSIAGTLAG